MWIGTWLACAEDGVLIALDGRGSIGPWSAARVYRGARPWPEPGTGGSASELRASSAAASFNSTFGAGDVDGWLKQWAEDAVFVSVIGPFEGPEVGDFFRNQARRYFPPKMTAERDHGAAADGALVMEGVLRGRCREGGSAFAFPYIMRIVLREGRLRHVYEAFASLSDGCGPFWTTPR